MSYPFNYPTPTNADVQIFNASVGSTSANIQTSTWYKPKGASFVWFTLIGAGGSGSPGDGTTNGGGGGSGAVTNCLVPAFLIPDQLNIRIGNGTFTAPTSVYYKIKNVNTILLTAASGGAGGVGAGGTGGTASTVANLGSAGLFQSVSGQDGAVQGSLAASSTTFLSGGLGWDGATTITGNYGYTASNASGSVPANGYFQMQPIIVGVGAGNNTGANVARTGVGCGGSGMALTNTTLFGYGGPGLAVIISW